MQSGRPKQPIVLCEEDRQQLAALARSRSLPHGLVRRAQLVLMAGEGLSNTAIAKRLHLSQQSVCLWRKRYLQHGLQGLHEELKSGRPRSVSDEMVADLVRKTLKSAPKEGTHWTIRSIAREMQLSRPTVHRIWSAFGLQPHRQKHFKLSTDPFFVEKVRDIVGLYVSPPEWTTTLRTSIRR